MSLFPFQCAHRIDLVRFNNWFFLSLVCRTPYKSNQFLIDQIIAVCFSLSHFLLSSINSMRSQFLRFRSLSKYANWLINCDCGWCAVKLPIDEMYANVFFGNKVTQFSQCTILLACPVDDVRCRRWCRISVTKTTLDFYLFMLVCQRKLTHTHSLNIFYI